LVGPYCPTRRSAETEALAAPPPAPARDDFDLIERARARARAVADEHRAIYTIFRAKPGD
jgi:hypothetical protein